MLMARTAPPASVDMMNKLLLPLLLLVLALVGVAWFALGTDPAAYDGHRLAEVGPGQANDVVPGVEDRSVELTEVREPEPEPERQAVAEAPKPARHTKARRAEDLPSNAIWAEGHIVFPAELPLDEGRVQVTARGRRFGGKQDPRREYVTTATSEGRFRIAFARSTRTGWVDVRGRYLYMDEKLSIKMSKLPPELVVEPKLGGVLHGRLTPPPGMEWTPEACAGTYATLSKWFEGGVNRKVQVGPGGEFELTGVPPGATYRLSVDSKWWVSFIESEVKIKAGEVTEFSGEMSKGVIVSGRVVDASDQPRGAVSVELTCVPLDDSWHHQTVQTEADGSFEFRGVAPGEVQITATLDGSLPAEMELGVLHEGDARSGLKLEVSEGRSISGFVHWPDGKPVEGAWVNVSQDKEVETFTMIFGAQNSEETAADGSFEVSGLEGGACVVRASARAARPEDVERAERQRAKGRKGKLRRRGSTYQVKVDNVEPGTTGLVLTLEAGDSVSGKVVDDLGEPLSRFLISARPVLEDQTELTWEDGFKRVVVSPSGSFEVDGLREGRWYVTARADDHASSERTMVTIPGAASLELRLPRLGRIHGIVRGPGGEPISGASLFIEYGSDSSSQSFQIREGKWGEEATTDNEGHFEIKDVSPGPLAVFANMEGFGQGPPQHVTLEPGQTLEGVSLRLRAGASIVGQVHAAAGQLGERSIEVSGQGEVSYHSEVQSDASGGFELSGLGPGKYRLQLQPVEDDGNPSMAAGAFYQLPMNGAGGGLAHNAIQYIELGEGERGRVVIGSPPLDPIVVTGRVTSGGEPVVDASVSCTSEQDSERNRDSATSDGEGHYSLTVSGAGSYTFVVDTGSGRVTSTHEVSATSARIDFELPLCSLSGTALGEGGEALEGVSLELVAYEDAAGEPVSRESRSAVSTEEGAFEFEHLEPGRYYLRASKRGDWNWRSRKRTAALGAILIDGLALEEGQRRADLELRLKVGGTIQGTVLGADGQGLGRANLIVTTESGRSLFTRRPTRSSALGSFTISGVGEGSYTVHAEKGAVVGAGVRVKVYSEIVSEVQLTVDSD